MSGALFVHFLALGTWLGCVAVEAVLEIAGAGELPTVARLHRWIDAFVEIPAFTAVVVSGLWMFDLDRFGGVYLAKILCGLAAVLVNVLCVGPVFARVRAVAAGDVTAARRHSRWIYVAFVAGMLPGFTALGLGLRMLGLV
ncbi:MAG: hypothetical protein HYV63_01290 [Candidatus Schekmanbacteria bacterium]|nr:hypothetical protein [Candidatus Schekmanbacteria bacterium]